MTIAAGPPKQASTGLDELRLAPAARPAHRERVAALDGLRGFAIAMVLVTHLFRFGYRPLIDLLFMKAADAGWVGVDLFFVLSGYLITGILYDTKESPRYFRTFYARRMLRIFPLYYGYLAILLLIVPLFLTARPELVRAVRDNQVWYWSYTTNILFASQSPVAKNAPHTGHFWSLAVEEQFYLLWPIIVLLLSRRRLLWVCAGALVASFLTRCTMRALGAQPEMVYLLLPTRMDGLAVGAAVALMARGEGGLSRWMRPIQLGAAIAGLGVVGNVITERGFDAFALTMQTFGYSCLAVALGGVLVLTLVRPPRLLSHPSLTFLGRYSYAIYVLHPVCLSLLPWLGLTADRIPPVGGSHVPGVILVGLVGTAISVVFAVVVWHGYEKQFLKLKRWFSYHPTARQRAERSAASASPPELVGCRQRLQSGEGLVGRMSRSSSIDGEAESPAHAR